MSNKPTDERWLPAQFFKNQDNFPQEELDQYAGLYVAFNWDGDRILASGTTDEEVWEKLKAAGIDTNRVALSYVDCP